MASNAPGPTRLDALQYSLVQLAWRQQLDGTTLSDVEHLVKRVCSGEWTQVIKESAALFSLGDDLEATVRPVSNGVDDRLRRLAVAAALLCLYVQTNFTGPTVSAQPADLFGNRVDEATLNAASLRRLALAGEPAYHLAKGATYLLLGLRLLGVRLDDDPTSSDVSLGAEDLPTLAWWRLRARVLQHRLVDERIPLPEIIGAGVKSLRKRLQGAVFDRDDKDGDLDRDLLSMLTLELGLAEVVVGDDKAANILFVEAVREAGLSCMSYSFQNTGIMLMRSDFADDLTGILGKRTKFQEKDVTQLVVLAVGRGRSAISDTSSERAVAGVTGDASLPATLPLNDDTLLERTQFTSTRSSGTQGDVLSSIDPANQPKLLPLDQCLLLALSLSVRNDSPSHGLTAVQIAPFVTRVLENAANWSVHSMALLLRSRLEASRTRTVERGLLQHQALVDQLAKEDAAEQADGVERVKWTWDLDLPSRWELERELARKLQGMGVTRSALEIFERLEMWDDVVACWQSLEKRDEGIRVVKDLLQGDKAETGVVMGKVPRDGKREAKLWCLLGELEGDPEHWRKAWEVSGRSSSRAMRSLGAYYFARSQFAESRDCLVEALRINPLFAKSWFILGCAAMRIEDWDGAEAAFGRCVALEDDDAEGWNNLASVHLRRAETEDPASVGDVPSANDEEVADVDLTKLATSTGGPKLPFSRRKAAFYCLRRAAQLSYDSWRIWTNYMIVAVDVGELSEAARAQARIIEKRGAVGLDLAVVERLVNAAIRPPGESAETTSRGRGNPNAGESLAIRLLDLFDRSLLVKCSGEPRVFLLYAKLLASRGQLAEAIDAHLAAYRIGVAQREEVATDLAAFAEASELLEATIDALRNWGPREAKGGGIVRKDWKWQSKSLVRGFLARTKPSFEDDERWLRLKEELSAL